MAVAAVRGPRCPPASLPGGQAHLTHQPLDSFARVPPAFPAQLGMDTGRAINSALGGEDAADVATQLGFRLGVVLDSGIAHSQA